MNPRRFPAYFIAIFGVILLAVMVAQGMAISSELRNQRLARAIDKADVGRVKSLLEEGADANAPAVLHYRSLAAWELIKELILRRPLSHEGDKSPPMIRAAWVGNPDV